MRKITYIWIVTAIMMIWTQNLMAAFGEDTDKPTPTFSQKDDSVIATLIPRGKSTKITIGFGAASGKLTGVTGMAFDTAKRDEVSSRDFRSDLFCISVGGIASGAEAQVLLRSDYFTTSTQFWVFNEKEAAPWSNAGAKVNPLPDRVKELVIQVKDGGPMDSDGLANGTILLVGGPLDSFWGYALGTLFIRFFGIFLVLSVLMLGMIASSRVFQWIERDKKKPVPSIAPALLEELEPSAAVSPEMAAAIGLALHLHLGSTARPAVRELSTESTLWAAQGRNLAMGARSKMFDRVHPVRKESK